MHNTEWTVKINLRDVEDGVTAYEFNIKAVTSDSPMVVIAKALTVIPLLDPTMISSIHMYRLDR